MSYKNTNNQFMLHDAVHGTIDLRMLKSEEENTALLELLNTQYFLRLRTVKQLGFAYFTHISADHNRFSHAIGTMYVMRKIFKQIEASATLKEALDEINNLFGLQLDNIGLRKHLLIAGLLQDLGEVPFAQALQEFITVSPNIESLLVQKLGNSFKSKDVKESLTLCVMYENEIHSLLQKLKANIPLLVFLITGKTFNHKKSEPLKAKSLLHMMNGEIDADRLDYVYRDLHHAYGTKGNPQAIISSLIYYDTDGPVFSDPGSVTEFLMTRGHLWTTVYLNPENRFKLALLKVVIEEVKKCNELKAKLNPILTIDLNTFKELDDLKFNNTLKEIKNDKEYINLSNRGKNALNNLLDGAEQYQWYWLKPPVDKAKSVAPLSLPNEVYYDLFIKYREHSLFSPKSIRIKAEKFRKLGEFVFLEDCSGAFVGFAQTGWATLPKSTSILVFFPVKTVGDGDDDASWIAFNNAFNNDSLYIQIETKELKARHLDLEINTWESVKDGDKIFVSFAFEDIEAAKKIATYLKDKGKRVKSVVSPVDGAGSDATTNSVQSAKEADFIIIVFSNNYAQKYSLGGKIDSHVWEEGIVCIHDQKNVIPIPIQNYDMIKNLDFPWIRFKGISNVPVATMNFEEETEQNINDFIEKALQTHGVK